MKNIPNPLITEIWKVQPSIGAQPWLVQYVILLQDGSHICTCLMLINKGIICRHFIKILTKSASAFFNISLIPSRWYNDQTAQLSGDEIHASPSIQLFNNSQSESIHITNIHTWILCVEEMFSNPIYVKPRRRPPQKDMSSLEPQYTSHTNAELRAPLGNTYQNVDYSLSDKVLANSESNNSKQMKKCGRL
ncbi:hypothetical protein GLOIN_2v1472538 [Rhizophagus clarus]|nr:hypothetical protein GLOIN_2v1472538 [Rhizophagus clarus]